MQIEQKSWTKESGWVSLSENGLKDKAQLVFIFGNTDILNTKQFLSEVKNFYPQAHFIGCSTSGEIIGTRVLDESVSMNAVFFEHTKLQFAKIEIKSMQDSAEVGEKLVGSLAREGLRHVFILSNGLNVNGSKLSEGLVLGLPGNVVATGGLAGDQGRFEKTLVFLDSEPQENAIVAVGFYGERLKVGYGSMGGWDSFGPDRLITRSKGNILFELDNQSALELYKKYLGEQAKGLPATALLFPLSLRSQKDRSGLVRTILSVNEKESSMTFAGDMPEGSYVRMMKANFDRLIDGAAEAAKMTMQGFFQPEFAILISCVGRKLVFKQRVEEEIEIVQDVLGKNTALAGFYSYGEICPMSAADKKCELHNQTMTITTFSEK